MPEFTWIVLTLMVLSTYRLCRLLIEDEITRALREWVWKKYPPETTKIGYWTTCYHCSSIFFAFFVVLSYMLTPAVAVPVFAVLAISAVVGFIDHKLNS
jgi:hypothetical protein